jgi:hypothetical protein
MFIVTVPSTSESRSRDIYEMEDEDTLSKWLLNYHSDLARVKIYKAVECQITLYVEKKDA